MISPYDPAVFDHAVNGEADPFAGGIHFVLSDGKHQIEIQTAVPRFHIDIGLRGGYPSAAVGVQNVLDLIEV